MVTATALDIIVIGSMSQQIYSKNLAYQLNPNEYH
jgi:hypothetical protein